MSREVWLPIEDFPLYEVSNFGRVVNIETGKFLRSSTSHGYHHISLSNKGVVETCRLHVLVLTTFCGRKPFENAHAAHNDGDKDNNNLTNLRWATSVENQKDVERHGNRVKGSDVFGAKLTEDDVREILRRCCRGELNPEIALEYNVSISTIHLIRHRKTWRHIS